MYTRLIAIALLIAVVAIGPGCTPGRKTEEGALIGAGAGAAGGAIAYAAGASPWWILGGAAAGALSGAIIGNSMEDHQQSCHAAHYECVHCKTVYCNSPSGCPSCHSREYCVYKH